YVRLKFEGEKQKQKANKDTVPSKAQQTLVSSLFSEMVKDMEVHFDMTLVARHFWILLGNMRFIVKSSQASSTVTICRTALKADSCKVTRHEKACIENQHVFVPFAFDTFGFLAPETVELLNRTQLMMEYMSTLQEEIASAKQLQNDDGGGGLNDLATNQTNSPQHLVTLPLFNG
nr:transcription factor, MADS-box [Tanacetum cinerariifolium]